MASKSEEKDARVKGMVDGMKGPKGKFKSMTIDAADNGYSVRTHREMPPKAKDDKEGDEGKAMPMSSAYGEGMGNTVHPDEDSVVAHVRHHLGK